ncbi:hypothetical protein [Paenibacillus soyae]|uniref:Glycosyl hydrolase n=1 Tax=Paenibacillus soyae TaxID=2969249 RepID=A0A9X2MVI9_9BACL|nr:hypothetical protein [Paenibacillus soyae]MCR2807821.1 hypothetical protein [Paenibacillus soyae]
MARKCAIAVLVFLLNVLPACAGQGRPHVPAPPTEAESRLLDYLLTEQLGEHGVYTNRLDTDQSDLLASGQEVLSESAGLLMRYYARSGDREAFEKAWNQARQTFDQPGSFSYRYSPKHNKRYGVNAAVDDLRIIRALFEAADSFGEKAYLAEAEQNAGRFLMHNVKDGKLFDMYDEHNHTTNAFITLCYVDHYTLSLMNEAGKKLRADMLGIVQEGYLSDAFPFYETRYDYESKQYVSDGINMVESLLTVLSLAEVGKQKETSIRFIKEKVAEGQLYGRYSREGEALTDVRSTALYALAAMIGHASQDNELYESAIRQMEQFRIQDPASELYGGFGDPATGQAYSFDNLTALLAYAAKR